LADEHPAWQRSLAFIALSAGLGSFAMNGWFPFLPLYMRGLGVENEARALFWVALAMASQGVARLIGGPLWGVLSDRYGRKQMYVRSLFGATATTVIVVAAGAPWVVALGMACQGFFSGFIPAAIALTSVTVPPSRLTSSMGTVQGAQYAGNTLGPAVGAGLAALFGLRGAILASAILPAAGALIVLAAVPRDRTTPRTAAALRGRAAGPGHLRLSAVLFGRQFMLGVFLFFVIWVMSQLVRTAAPVALARLAGEGAATGATGLAFTLGGLASVIGALGLTRLVGRAGRLRLTLTLTIVAAAVAQVFLGLAWSVLVFTLAFTVVSLTQAAMMPATNAIIATSVPPERRGTAFGVATSAQAASFIVGPMGAAFFAAVSLELGFMLLGVMLAASAVVTYLVLRESAEAPTSVSPDSSEHTRSRAPA
jgi:DHA1 family multidrug resistance protein-like MFS transporter